MISLLRKHWLLVITIVIGVLWWPVFHLLTPPMLGYFVPSLTNVDYWSMIAKPELFWIALVGFIIVGIAAFIQLWRIASIVDRSILIIATLFSCSISTCTSAVSLIDGRSIHHVMNMNYKNNLYQLALSSYGRLFDGESSSYYVFECDAQGKICTLIKSVSLLCCDYSDGQLLVSNDKLILEAQDKQTQILPAVNGSS